jgi:MobA-like NTP transferase domain
VPNLAPLVLLAAGLGSRFGGIKPLAPVGPNGEPLLLVSLGQAADAGFDRAVIVVSPRSEQVIFDALAQSPLPCTFAVQTTPMSRSKPLGTVDAALRAYDSLLVAPSSVVVANGDDLYGSIALRAALDWTVRYPVEGPDHTGPQRVDVDKRPNAAAVLYALGTTVPRGEHGGEQGGVSRAVVGRDGDGRLLAISERRGVRWDVDVLCSATSTDLLSPDEAVSMNLWCLSRGAVDLLRVERDRLVASTDPDGEVGLPDTINRLVHGGRLRVDTTVTTSTWHGVTWADDVAVVRAALVAESHVS